MPCVIGAFLFLTPSSLKKFRNFFFMLFGLALHPFQLLKSPRSETSISGAYRRKREHDPESCDLGELDRPRSPKGTSLPL